VGSRGPKPAGSCAAAPSGFATAAKAELRMADSGKRKSANRLKETAARIGERGFMGENSKVRLGRVFLRCPARYQEYLHATKNRRELGGLVMWVGIREIGWLIVLCWPGLVIGVGAAGALWVLGFRMHLPVRQRCRERRMEEELAVLKVERSMEKAALAERLLRAEKLAGLGLMAGGMVHALNNPLTAVLGFAELIMDTTGEERVKEDAAIVVREAQRMRQTVETLLEFWRPAGQSEELVDVAELVRELAGACAKKLENRGVRLVVQVGDEAIVPGNRGRLRQMFEHLLNNSAQALAGVAKSGEEQVIRVSISKDGPSAYLVVSDTGPGFRAPGRVFELCEGAGLGLSVCYGTVREHGGKISALNLHPHGAAVAVELPGADFAIKKSERVAAALGERVSV